jgi:uncharacterized delta-60 repeat protein
MRPCINTWIGKGRLSLGLWVGVSLMTQACGQIVLPQAANIVPQALNQTVVVPKNTPVNVVMSAVDTGALIYSVVTQPSHGTLSTVNGSSIIYTPDNNYTGADSFIFKANDGFVDSNIAAVSFIVNNLPVANAQSVSTAEESAKSIVLSGSDQEGGPVTFKISTQPAHGTLSALSGSNIVYTPALNYYGSDSFGFKSNDGYSDSAEAVVSITVTPVNDLPVSVAVADSTAEDSAKVIALSASDIDGDALSYSVITPPQHGSLGSVSGNSVTYTPALNYNGSDSFTYRTHDGTGSSNTATVSLTVTPVNDAPVASNQNNVPVTEDTDKEITLVATDVDSDPMTYLIVTPPTMGSLSVVSGNKVTYSPSEGYHGTDSFSFRANDGSLDSNVATVNITVASVNDPPTVGPDQHFDLAYRQPVSITLVGADADEDGLSFPIVSSPAHGILIGAGTANVVYRPGMYEGSDSFSYRVSDGMGTSAIATVTFTMGAKVVGGLDPSWAEGGMAITQIGGTGGSVSERVISLAELPGGDVLVAYSLGDSWPAAYAIRRYNSSGVRVTTYGTQGALTLADIADINRMYRRSDGKIWILANLCLPSSWNCGSNPGLILLNSNGEIDASFGSGGYLELNPGNYSYFGDTMLLSDDSLIVDVSTDSNSFDLRKISAAGVLDSSFGSGGSAYVSIPGGDDGNHYNYSYGKKFSLLGDGSILLSSYFYVNTWQYTDLFLGKLNADGSQNTGFGNLGNGWQFYNPTGSAYANIGPVFPVGTSGEALVSSNGYMLKISDMGVPDTNYGDLGNGFQTLSFSFDNSVNNGDGTFLVYDWALSNLATVDSNGSFGTTWSLGYYSSGAQVYSQFGSTYVYGAYSKIYSQVLYNNGMNYETYGGFVSKLNVSGQSIDSSFAGGNLQDSEAFSHDFGSAVKVLSNGKVLVAGSRLQDGSNGFFNVVRYTSYGALDSSFGTDGVASIQINGSGPVQAQAIETLSDGSIVVTGHAYDSNSGFWGISVYKLLANGVQDTSFGDSGVRHVYVPGWSVYFNNDSNYDKRSMSMKVNASNQIVVSTGYYDNSNSSQGIFMARMSSTGVMDTSFDGDGMAMIQTSNYPVVSDIAIQADGKVLVAGSLNSGQAFVARISGAALDASFAPAAPQQGYITFYYYGSSQSRAYSVAIDSSGRVLVGGFVDYGMAIARFTPAGELDSTFGTDGVFQQKDSYNYGASIQNIFVQSDGTIVLGGVEGQWPWSTGHNFYIARLTDAGAFDTSFSDDGYVTYDLGAKGESRAFGMAIDADGCIVQSGTTDSGGMRGRDFGTIRVFQ